MLTNLHRERNIKKRGKRRLQSEDWVKRGLGSCCSPVDIPVVRGEVGHACHCLFLHFLSPHFSLTMYNFIKSLQLLFFAVLPSPPTLFRSFLAQSSRCILILPHLIFPSTFWASDLFASFFISHFLNMTGPCQSSPHQFRLKPFLWEDQRKIKIGGRGSWQLETWEGKNCIVHD